MALVTMREILQDARRRKYAVGGFNVFNFETLGAVIEAAEELKTPLVVGIPERLFKFVDVDTLSAAMVRAAKRSHVPIALHLDHGYTQGGIMKAIDWGFTSVMFDGSGLLFEDNLNRTKEICRIAHSLGVSVEGELGYIGGCGNIEAISDEHLVTADMAAEFVDRTGVDALAVAIGNHHGAYRGHPKLNFSRLNELSSTTDIPLVMHGGAKLSADDYRNSISSGISKVNIATDMSLTAAEKLKSELDKTATSNYIHLMSVVKKGVKDSARNYMLNFNCILKAVAI